MSGNIGVDAIIPVYNERPESVAATLSACLAQTYPISQVFLVDDGSAKPVYLPDWARSRPSIHLIRLPENVGISAARNAAIAQSTAPLLACVNTEVLPDPDWLRTGVNYLCSNATVGCCYTRMVPKRPKRLLSRWRMRFHEAHYGKQSGASHYAPGHAALIRRAAIDSVQGYDVRLRRIMEDSDLCERMSAAGWGTHYIAESQCISIQEDSLANLCRKQLARSGWTSSADYSLGSVVRAQSKWLAMRAGRNVVKGRLLFLPIDLAIWTGSLLIALRDYNHSTGTGDGASMWPKRAR